MAIGLGTDSTIEVSTDGGSTYGDLGLVRTGSISFGNDSVESTTNDDAGYKSELAGNSQLTMTATCAYDETSAKQMALVDAVHDKTYPNIRVRPFVGTGLMEYIFKAHVKKYDAPAASNNKLLEISFDVVSTGAVLRQAQT